MGASWEAKIYINGKNHSSLQVRNDTPLQEIRDSLNINVDYHFISRNDGFIERETDFTAKNVWKNDEEKGGYKIDLMTREYFESFQSDTVDLYFNMFRNKAIKYDPNMTLEHLMPQTIDPSEPEGKWWINHLGKSKYKDIQEKYTDCIGNYALLTRK